MIVVTYEKKIGYYINGTFVSRSKRSVVSEHIRVGEVLIGNACDRAKTLSQTVTIYQLPNGRWTHDKMKGSSWTS